MPDVFLSYSREDQPTAKRVAESLGREGLNVWWDQTLRSGEAYDEVTEQALKSARAVVVLWSRTSVVSRWVRAEATIADRAGTLMPIMIESCERPVMFELRQSADLSGWQGSTSDPRWKTFVDDLRAFIGRTPAGRQEPSVRDLAAATNSTTSRHWRTIAIGTLVLVLIAAGAWVLMRERGEGSRSAAATGKVEQAATEPSVAVLPFDDMSPSKDQGYFADGIAEEILNSLARVKDLQVSGRTSSFTFKGKNDDLKVIGEKLGVANILEGSVRKDGDRIRVTAQLNKAANGFHLWSKTYDRPKGDVFAIQEDIARAVAEALQIRLGVGELGHIPGMTRDPDAYDALLEGMSGSLTTDRAGSEKRIERLEYAVGRDPSFAFAWMVLADVYINLAQIGGGDRQEIAEWLQRARTAEEKVQRLLPDSSITKALPTIRAFSRGEWTDVARVLKQYPAMFSPQELNLPAAFGVPQLNERFLVMTDHSGDAINGLRRLRTREPLDASIALYLGEAYANSGDLDAAITEQDRGLGLNEAAAQAIIVANALMTAKSNGDAALIEARWKRFLANSGDPMGLYPLRNRPTDALALLRRVAQTQPENLSSSRLALWAAYFGDPELALQALRGEKLDERRTITALAIWRPVMRDMRKLPGFKDLVREMGYVEYWREFGWGDHCKPVGDTDFECH
jgi:TolB-like protein